ncbi:EcsC protein family [Bordetella ansorpii]|uniref:EcsC protein family n=1 Tax=Bordetella ansorpii TaxID=288768 RepID=A0A157SLH3_9BORD|nr:EcsC family protein [Bordetella ansorpii]SAI71330.1 EcsC protein family [Bordetella ansorpii]
MQNPLPVLSLAPDTPDYRDLERAVALLVSPTLTARITSMVGKPLERLLEYVPDGWEKNLHKLVEGALSKAADAALWSLNNKPQEASPWWNKAYAAASGGVGGFFGFTGLAMELPVSTTILMRAVADVARSEGFDLSDIETKQACIEVFALGGETKQDDQAETTYYAMRVFTAETVGFIAKELAAMTSKEATSKVTGAWLAALIKKVASRFGVVVTEKAAAQAIPLIGAAGGAAINVMFTGFYQDMARGHFIVKRLEKKYGFEAVKQAFEAVRKRSPAG